jgi:hypothetical protein
VKTSAQTNKNICSRNAEIYQYRIRVPSKFSNSISASQFFCARSCFDWLSILAAIGVEKLRRNRDEKKVGAAAANDDGGANFAAGQIREGNRQKDDIISRAVH